MSDATVRRAARAVCTTRARMSRLRLDTGAL
jgi:hypothetical protein